MSDQCCQWGELDCSNFGEKCELCSSPRFHYKAPKKRSYGLKPRAMKADKRTGSTFEFKTYEKNQQNLVDDVSTRLTPNSGAGYVKGDVEISGIVSVMEELKTKVVQKAPGKETFTIHKTWLDKLNREANAANKEFWYLRFSFLEQYKQNYVITESELIDSMVKTMVHDRKQINIANAKADLAEKQRRKAETDIVAARAEIDVLRAELDLLKLNTERNDQ